MAAGHTRTRVGRLSPVGRYAGLFIKLFNRQRSRIAAFFAAIGGVCRVVVGANAPTRREKKERMM